MLVSEIYVEDNVIFNQNEIIVGSWVEYRLPTVNQDFILSFDYYPVDYWEWAWIRLDNVNYGVWSSSYDKGNNIGITNLGSDKWIHLTYKYENGIVTITAGNNTVTQTINKDLPFDVDLYSNRRGTHYKNLKFKTL